MSDIQGETGFKAYWSSQSDLVKVDVKFVALTIGLYTIQESFCRGNRFWIVTTGVPMVFCLYSLGRLNYCYLNSRQTSLNSERTALASSFALAVCGCLFLYDQMYKFRFSWRATLLLQKLIPLVSLSLWLVYIAVYLTSQESPTNRALQLRNQLLELEVRFQRRELAADPHWRPSPPAHALLTGDLPKALEVAQIQDEAYSRAKAAPTA